MKRIQRIAIGRIAIGGALCCATLGWSYRASAQQAAASNEQGDVLYFNQGVPPPAEAGVKLEGIDPIVDQAVGKAMMSVGPIVSQAVGDAMTKAFTFVSAIGPGIGATVTGAPYSAQASTETVQTLADGNRIIHKNTSSLYRDSQGRTRRDQTLDDIGPFGSATNPPNLTFITDPVAHLQYVLDNNAKTARKMPLPDGASSSVQMPALPPLPPAGGEKLMIFRTGPADGMPPVPPSGNGANPTPVNEDLGTQTIEGLQCQGTRSTVTIPAGAIGNDLPIKSVSERWYCPALQLVVLSTNSDPRMGKTTYQLTNISRDEPAAALFQVPPGYTITQPPIPSASGFAGCAAAGGTVSPGPPRQCTTSDGRVYIDAPAVGVGANPKMMIQPFPKR